MTTDQSIATAQSIGVLAPFVDEFASLPLDLRDLDMAATPAAASEEARAYADELLEGTTLDPDLRMRSSAPVAPPATPRHSAMGRITAGSFVIARADGRSRWLPGQVRTAHADGTYAVDFESGAHEEHVVAKHIQLQGAQTPGSGPGAGAGATHTGAASSCASAANQSTAASGRGITPSRRGGGARACISQAPPRRASAPRRGRTCTDHQRRRPLRRRTAPEVAAAMPWRLSRWRTGTTSHCPPRRRRDPRARARHRGGRADDDAAREAGWWRQRWWQRRSSVPAASAASAPPQFSTSPDRLLELLEGVEPDGALAEPLAQRAARDLRGGALARGRRPPRRAEAQAQGAPRLPLPNHPPAARGVEAAAGAPGRGRTEGEEGEEGEEGGADDEAGGDASSSASAAVPSRRPRSSTRRSSCLTS